MAKTQDVNYRYSLVCYAKKHGVTKTAIKYHTNRQYVYRWLDRYDGTLESLEYRSRRPHHHPNEHTGKEAKLIKDMRRRNPNDGLVVFWVKLRQRGYTRSITGLYRYLKKQEISFVKPKNPKRISKPYEQMTFPGQRVQIDVKVVPKVCISNYIQGEGYFQYTAIDECTRHRYVEAFPEQSTFSSAQFAEHLIKAFPFPILCVQTDNGTEFTNRFTTERDKPTLFQETLWKYGIYHKHIKPYTPRHNGKVERSHRKDNERFYATHRFMSFEDFAHQLKRYNAKDYNKFPMRPLNWKSPKEALDSYLTRLREGDTSFLPDNYPYKNFLKKFVTND